MSLLVINIIPALFCQSPSTKSQRTKFDIIIVLGNPANSDGSPSEVMRQRVLTAVELFRTGRARYIYLQVRLSTINMLKLMLWQTLPVRGECLRML